MIDGSGAQSAVRMHILAVAEWMVRMGEVGGWRCGNPSNLGRRVTVVVIGQAVTESDGPRRITVRLSGTVPPPID